MQQEVQEPHSQTQGPIHSSKSLHTDSWFHERDCPEDWDEDCGSELNTCSCSLDSCSCSSGPGDFSSCPGDFSRSLPAEMTEHIFLQLDPLSLCRASQTCRRWHHFIQDRECLWRGQCLLLRAHCSREVERDRGRGLSWKVTLVRNFARSRLKRDWLRGRFSCVQSANELRDVKMVPFDAEGLGRDPAGRAGPLRPGLDRDRDPTGRAGPLRPGLDQDRSRTEAGLNQGLSRTKAGLKQD
ncbi:hypothetical protein WMY93_006793 [Mugilogobius chulae]|uniref:F-box domain-containing protein n=1 Tax=Mugilogobius chulae TaxID=88201 RepID=A0AAW0PL11_9GOBI